MPNDQFGVGASLLRKEDDRHLHGRGQFVSDIKLPGTMDVAFVRSPHAHARIRSISVPPEARGRVFTAADLPQVTPIRVVTAGGRRQVAGLAAARHRQGALCRRGDRRLHRPVPRRGGRPCQCRHRSISRCCRRWSTPRARCAAAPPSSTSNGATISTSSGRSKVATSRRLHARPRSR